MAKSKKTPMRQCIGCHENKEKKELIRIVKINTGEIFVDKSNKSNGRGAYLCNDINCLEKAIRSKALNRSLKVDVPEEILHELEDSMKE